MMDFQKAMSQSLNAANQLDEMVFVVFVVFVKG